MSPCISLRIVPSDTVTSLAVALEYVPESDNLMHPLSYYRPLWYRRHILAEASQLLPKSVQISPGNFQINVQSQRRCSLCRLQQLKHNVWSHTLAESSPSMLCKEKSPLINYYITADAQACVQIPDTHYAKKIGGQKPIADLPSDLVCTAQCKKDWLVTINASKTKLVQSQPHSTDTEFLQSWWKVLLAKGLLTWNICWDSGLTRPQLELEYTIHRKRDRKNILLPVPLQKVPDSTWYALSSQELD